MKTKMIRKVWKNGSTYLTDYMSHKPVVTVSPSCIISHLQNMWPLTRPSTQHSQCIWSCRKDLTSDKMCILYLHLSLTNVHMTVSICQLSPALQWLRNTC